MRRYAGDQRDRVAPFTIESNRIAEREISCVMFTHGSTKSPAVSLKAMNQKGRAIGLETRAGEIGDTATIDAMRCL
jgi:hypothetical protein